MLPIASNSAPANIVAWVLQIIGAGVLLIMGAVPKLTGQFPSPQLFEMMGVPEFTRYVVGVIELVTGVLLVIPKTRAVGGFFLVVSMLGAIAAHAFTPLGFTPEFVNATTGEEIQPPLIFMAIGLLIMGFVIMVLRRDEMPCRPCEVAEIASSVVDDVI